MKTCTKVSHVGTNQAHNGSTSFPGSLSPHPQEREKSAFNGETTMITGDGATGLSHLILSRNSEGRRRKIMDFPYPVGKMATTSRP